MNWIKIQFVVWTESLIKNLEVFDYLFILNKTDYFICISKNFISKKEINLELYINNTVSNILDKNQKKLNFMEFLFTLLSVFLVVIRWIIGIIFFLFATALAIGAILSWLMTYDEKKTCKKDDAGWKLFCLIALILTILSLILALLGYLII